LEVIELSNHRLGDVSQDMTVRAFVHTSNGKFLCKLLTENISIATLGITNLDYSTNLSGNQTSVELTRFLFPCVPNEMSFLHFTFPLVV